MRFFKSSTIIDTRDIEGFIEKDFREKDKKCTEQVYRMKLPKFKEIGDDDMENEESEKEEKEEVKGTVLYVTGKCFSIILSLQKSAKFSKQIIYHHYSLRINITLYTFLLLSKSDFFKNKMIFFF